MSDILESRRQEKDGKETTYYTHISFIESKQRQQLGKSITVRDRLSFLSGLTVAFATAGLLGSKLPNSYARAGLAAGTFGVVYLGLRSVLVGGHYNTRLQQLLNSPTSAIPFWNDRRNVVSRDRLFYTINDQTNKLELLHDGLSAEQAANLAPTFVQGNVKALATTGSAHH